MSGKTARRGGFTLVEMLAAISTGVILLGLATMLIAALVKLDKAGRARLAEESHLDRLARAFRADVHAPTGLGPGAGPAALTLTLPEGRAVAYRAVAGAVIRVRVVGADRREDRYPLPARSTARFDPGRDAVGLFVDRAPGRAGLRIDAVLGSDHRFANLGEGRE